MKEKIFKMAKWRVLLSIFLVLGLVISATLYEKARGPVEGRAAVLQLENSDASYVAGKTIADGGIPQVIGLSCAGVLCLMWVSFIYSGCCVYFEEKKKEKKSEDV